MRRLLCVVVSAFLAGGCMSRVISYTPRTAVEQMLLSGAVDRALTKFQLPIFRGRKVFLDFSNLEGTDSGYVRSALRAHVAELGATLVTTSEQAHLTVEAASGGLGTEFKDFLIGLPALPIPNTSVVTPEAPIFKDTEQTGIFKLFIFVHAQGNFIASAQYYAKCDKHESIVLWWRINRKDQIREGWDQADARNTAIQLDWTPVTEKTPASPP
jgi:hypothetical protein